MLHKRGVNQEGRCLIRGLIKEGLCREEGGALLEGGGLMKEGLCKGLIKEGGA